MQEIITYYNKFKENKRLLSRHGQVEFITTLKYIKEFIPEGRQMKILDVGAGTGRYSIQLANEGHDVTALELVEHNLDVLKSQKSSVKAFQGNALDLSRFQDNQFDMTLVFGPMYHLFTKEDKVRVLQEAKRVTKPNGYLYVAYIMNEYSVLTYAFKENNIKQCLEENRLSKDFHTISQPKDLYDYVRLEDIKQYNKEAQVQRVKIIAADGPANYMRPILKAMDEETFQTFMEYHLSTCERADLMGASAHTVDILRKE